MIKDGKFYYKNKEYDIEKRNATKGEMIIAVPHLYNFEYSVRENVIPFNKPLVIRKSLNSIVFSNEFLGELLHGEYYVITPARKQKIKIGEHTNVKRFLGIPVWKSTKYEYKYI